MDQKRPYNDIPNGDTAPMPPVSGDTVPLPAPGEGTPAPETDKAAPENGAPSPETAKAAPEQEKKPDAKKAKKKAPREKRSRGMSRGARTALAVGDAAISTVGDMVRFIVRIVLSVLLVLLLGGRTGRDGIGGATGSSKEHNAQSLEECGSEVQKGNAPEERKLQRRWHASSRSQTTSVRGVSAWPSAS